MRLFKEILILGLTLSVVAQASCPYYKYQTAINKVDELVKKDCQTAQKLNSESALQTTFCRQGVDLNTYSKANIAALAKAMEDTCSQQQTLQPYCTAFNGAPGGAISWVNYVANFACQRMDLPYGYVCQNDNSDCKKIDKYPQ